MRRAQFDPRLLRSTPHSTRSPAASLSTPGLLIASLGFFAFACAETTPPPQPSPEHETPDEISYHGHIAPLLAKRCTSCHKESGIGGFPLDNYDDAVSWSSVSLLAIESQAMPPFGARSTAECRPLRGWRHDLRLSDEEQLLFADWVAAGTPLGDPNTAAELPDPPPIALDDPSWSGKIPTEVEVEGDNDRFVCALIDPGLEVDHWVDGIQIRAGNPDIVHHVLVYSATSAEWSEIAGDDGIWDCSGGALTGDKLLGVWAPGSVPMETPPKVAMKLRARSKIILNIHYHPTGGGRESDADTAVDLRWSQDKPEREAELFLLGNFEGSADGEEDRTGLLPGPGDRNGEPEFRIPKGAKKHVEHMLFNLGNPDEDDPEVDPTEPLLHLWTIGAHMHYLGRDMQIWVDRDFPSGGEPIHECLLQTPNWDFEWQRLYHYRDQLNRLPNGGLGDVLNMRCTYDNSMGNHRAVERMQELGLETLEDAYLGDESLDEMCIGVFGVVYVPDEDEDRALRGRSAARARVLQRLRDAQLKPDMARWRRDQRP